MRIRRRASGEAPGADDPAPTIAIVWSADDREWRIVTDMETEKAIELLESITGGYRAQQRAEADGWTLE